MILLYQKVTGGQVIHVFPSVPSSQFPIHRIPNSLLSFAGVANATPEPKRQHLEGSGEVLQKR